jgi:hypothetical protein
MRAIILLAVIAAIGAAAPSDAEACSPPPCWAGHFTPADGATVPASLPAIYWDPSFGSGASSPDPSKVVLTRASAPGVELPFTATPHPGGFLLVPAQPLMPGEQYVLVDQSTCGSAPIGPSGTFLVASAAPLPASLGTLVESVNRVGPLQVAAGGACTTEVDAHQIGIELQLSAEAAAWRDVLHFETLVDGRAWRASRTPDSPPPGESWRGRGVDLVYRVCAPGDDVAAEGLTEGAHEVVMRATLPGTATVVQSSALTVHIQCGAGSPGSDAGGGCDAGGAGSSGGLLLGGLGGLAAIAGVRRSGRWKSRAS